jgi:hypothetical protein
LLIKKERNYQVREQRLLLCWLSVEATQEDHYRLERRVNMWEAIGLGLFGLGCLAVGFFLGAIRKDKE